jgi:hypothetical protein
MNSTGSDKLTPPPCRRKTGLHIMDLPIPKTMRLQKPLSPSKAGRPVRKGISQKEANVNLLKGFDPLFDSKRPRPSKRPSDDLQGIRLVHTPFAVGTHLRGWVFRVPEGHNLEADPVKFLGCPRYLIKKKITQEVFDLNGVKFQLAMKVSLRKERNDGDLVLAQPMFYSKQQATLRASDIDEGLNEAISKIERSIEEYQREGSGWAVDRVIEIFINIARYQPFHGGSYIDLPASLKREQAVINVMNTDNHCLKWSLLASMFPAIRNPQRPTKYRPFWGSLDFTGIDSPTPLTQIKKVERQNRLAINMFEYDKGIYQLHISEAPAHIPRVNLLLIEKGGVQNFTWIKDLNRLLYDHSKHQEREHFCER